MSSYLENAKEILKKLKESGYQAYFVGGYVRDTLLQKEALDIDITTSATPSEVEAVFDHVKHTGRNFGGVTVLCGEHRYEVTTFRLEGAYKNHRHPKEVTFSTNVLDDVIRRDFTVNGLLMDEHGKIYDYVHGEDDLHSHCLRTIGNPQERFHEDALRILRAFRFVSKLGFDLEETTKQALKETRHLVKTIKIERTMQELEKIISGPYQKKALQFMIDTQVHEELFGLQKGIEYVSTIEDVVEPLELFMISFILDDISDVWRFSNKDIRLIYQVINLHEVTKNEPFNKFILFSNKIAPCLITNRINVLLGYQDQQHDIEQMWNEMPVKDVCDLAFKGQDILELTTLKKRSVIGLVIDDLLFNVIMGIMPNEYDVLKPFALQKVEELQREMRENDE